MSFLTRKDVMKDQQTLSHDEKRRITNAVMEEETAKRHAGEALAAFEKLKAKGGTLKRLHDQGVPPIEWRIPHLLSAQGKMMVFGSAGTGKSFAAMQLGLAAAGHGPWLGYHEVPRLRILYLDAEMGLQPFFHNFGALIRGYAAPWPENVAYYPCGVMPLDDDIGPQVLDELCALHRPDIVILDTVRGFLSGGEDKPEFFKAFVRTLDDISERYGVAWVMLQHMPKTSARMNPKQGLRLEDIHGSVAQGGWLDAAIGLRQLGENRLGVFHAKLRLARKGKDVNDFSVIIPADEGDAYRYTYDAALTESTKVQEACTDALMAFLERKVSSSGRGKVVVSGRELRAEAETFKKPTYDRARKALIERGILIQDETNMQLYEVVRHHFVDDN